VLQKFKIPFLGIFANFQNFFWAKNAILGIKKTILGLEIARKFRIEL